jgi:small subunit ribosomal protein S20
MADNKKENGGKEKKERKPSALKREAQNLQRNARNRSFKAKVTTAVRSFKESLTQKDAPALKTKLNAIFSLMDKGVKKGIFKLNKANRVKSRLHTLTK